MDGLSSEYDALKVGERAIITAQLNRSPRNLAAIAKRCASGFPEVIVTHPVFFYQQFPEIFPTLYWLSCPRLVKEVARLEGGGAIEEIQKKILADPQLSRELTETNQHYAKKRLTLVKKPTINLLKSKYPGQWDVLLHSGVGGSLKAGIKCLHAHLADFLIEGKNPVGQLIEEKLAEKIDEECTQCSQK